jgi:AcrR family transcriptional regulator
MASRGTQRLLAEERRPLDEDSIVAAALEIVRTGGVEALSMRSLTDHLGVAVGATYRHVSGKDELLAACARRIFEQIVESDGPPDDDPIPWLRDLLLRLIDTLADYPGLAPWLVRHGTMESNRLRPAVTAALAATGMDEAEMLRTMHVLFFFVNGALLTDYRTLSLRVGVTDHAEQLRLDIEFILSPRMPRRPATQVRSARKPLLRRST